jgi:hypothetical protein
MSQNSALYYPSIEFANPNWLWCAALLWDRIYRIVPKGYEPEDSENIKILCESGEIGIPLDPGKYAAAVAKDFIDQLENGGWDAAALDRDIPEEYTRLHPDKVDVKLRELIVAKGRGSASGEWLHVPTQFEAHYMTYLANHVARQNSLHLLSDSGAAWTSSTYFKFNGQVESYPRDNLVQQLALLVIRDFIPIGDLALLAEDILAFREKRRAERQRFMQAIKTAAATIANCADETVFADRIDDLRREIEESLNDYRKSADLLKVAGWTGLKSIAVPVITKVATEISGHALDVTQLNVISDAGIALGLMSGLRDWQAKNRKLDKEYEYSYLMHLGRKWKKCALYKHDYNYYLCREMEEFIND